MRSVFIAIIAATLLAACKNGDTSTSILEQPPYSGLTDSIRRTPAQAGLWYRRGVMLYQNGETALAQTDIRKAWDLQPTEEFGLSLITILKEKNTDSVIVFLQEAIKKVPGSIAFQVGLARGYQAKGDKEKALSITNAILAAYPGQLDALTLQADLLSAEKPDEALAELERAYSLVPSDPGLAYDLAFAYAEAKNAKIISLTDSLIKAKAPEIEKAYYTRALFFSNTAKTTEALAAFDQSIRANYNFLDAYLDKGKLLYREKRFSEALRVFEKGLQVRSTEAQFYFWGAKTQLAMGNKAEAKQNFEKAYGLDKDLTEAKQEADQIE